MALNFPLPLETFFDGLPIEAGTVDLGEAVEMSENGYGEILTAALGNRLWKLDVEIASRDYRQGEAIKAQLNTLRYPGRSLIARASPSIGPLFDPTGVILGGATPTLFAVAPNNREVTIGGLPAGYKLSVGDFLSFTYGANPTRYALHQIVIGGTAQSNGRAAIELSSFIAPGYTTGTAVKLIKPVFKAIVIPGSTDPGRTGGQRLNGIKFSLIQTFR